MPVGFPSLNAASLPPLPAVPMDPSGNSVPDGQRGAERIGPDVIVGDLSDVWFWGTSAEGIGAFSVGTISCNVGDEWLNWIWNTSEHPVIAQAMYRLKDDRFEQIGMSWLKHGFYATSGTLCSGPGQCAGDPQGEHLGVGCSDPYSAWLNGQQSNLSPRSIVNPNNGRFVVPWFAPPPDATIGRRLQVRVEDYDPALNAGALFFAEGHYITHDDAVAGNQDNNASYRRLSIAGSTDSPFLQLLGATQRTKPAIRAWRDTDPDVVETDIEIQVDGIFILAANAVDLETGFWRYEYALHNLNSHRSCGAFSVPVDPEVLIENVGFHDIDHHSGEPYDTTDWVATRDDSTLSWATDSFESNPNANALRFGTLYNFWFEADAPPAPTQVTISLFLPSSFPPDAARTVGPASAASDCNSNGLNDQCDLSCAWPGDLCDLPGCGESLDVDGNLVPDDCQPDCNENMVPDELDIAAGTSGDCNANLIPDECEIDSDSDMLIDDCDPCPEDPNNDEDGDGTCAPEDQCPFDGTKIQPGICGCGRADEDGDGDGAPDCLDGCPDDPLKSEPGACGCGVSETDSDADAVPDCLDLCPNLNDSIDLDANGTPDCSESIPASSSWGLFILGLLLAVSAKIAFGKYSPA